MVTLDPFGYSESDTKKVPSNWGERAGNNIHFKTRENTIRNLLLFKKNEHLDYIKLIESERLIRSQRYVHRVIIKTEAISKKSDSIDVSVRVLDTWSLTPEGSLSGSSLNFELNERNFLGLGHEFDNRIVNRFSDKKNGYNIKYTVPNFKNTYIRTTLIYNKDLNDFYDKSIAFDRPFFSPLTRWAGGIKFNQTFSIQEFKDLNNLSDFQNNKNNTQDFWIGHANGIFNGSSVRERTTKFILTAGFLNVNYIESPKAIYDTIGFYTNERFFLSGIGIASRQFKQDSYIFNYGVIEDVPIGKIYGITGGYQYKNQRERLYAGARASFGKYFKWGYLSTDFQYGTFFRANKTNQSAFSFQSNYFTKLIDLGKWKLRQFIKSQLILGQNRLDTPADRLILNDNYGLSGFSSSINGTKKVVLTFQTQAYSPWNLIGFRINPFFNYAVASLGTSEIPLTQSKYYSKIGFGVIISNDYLVFNSFQISFAYYPKIPDQGDNLFKNNAFRTTDFGFQDFDLGRPQVVPFR
ncbi:MAG: hypothetical protein H7239_04000 [Flavobacterium sp.]|nr:hypothetical protein [Flavobacterium sp.]